MARQLPIALLAIISCSLITSSSALIEGNGTYYGFFLPGGPAVRAAVLAVLVLVSDTSSQVTPLIFTTHPFQLPQNAR